MHRHNTPLRGVKVIPHPKADDPNYTAVNYEYAGKAGHVHEVVSIGGREFVKVGFDDRKIVYYFIEEYGTGQAREARYVSRPVVVLYSRFTIT